MKNNTTIKRYDKFIKDATDDLVIRVNEDDIKGAVCRHHQKCFIARAIMRQRSSTVKWVDVGNSVVLVGTGKRTGQRYYLKGKAKEQVRYFDSHDGRFAPCVVSLAAPIRHKLGTRTNEAPGKTRKRNRNRQQPTR